MSSPATLVRERVKEIVEDEFSAEGLICANDKLPRAAGHDGVTKAAVSPIRETEKFNNVAVLEIEVLLQIYHGFQDIISETQAVDPSVIEAWAERLRGAFSTQSSGNTGDMWYLRLASIDYPDDATGNKTRLEATIVADANNPASSLP